MSGTSDNLALAIVTVFAGSTVHGILGFGCGLVWMSVFPLFTTVPDAVGVLQPLPPAMNLLVLWKTFGHATPRELKPLALTVPIGIGVGLWIVTSWSAKAVNGFLGAFLIMYTFLRNDGTADRRGEGCGPDKQKGGSIEMQAATQDAYSENDSETVTMVVPDKNVRAEFEEEEFPAATALPGKSKPQSRRPPHMCDPVALLAGFFAGCLAAAFGTGGPPILVFAREAGWESEPDTFRANLQLIFFYISALTISSQMASGIITTDTLRSTVRLVPALVGGAFAGSKFAPWVPRDTFRTLVLNGLRIMGIIFISKSIR